MSKKQQKENKNILEIIANENIVSRDIIEEVEESSLNYAVKTIIDRALPDVRDGLKPSQRRVLFGMHGLNLYPGHSYVKSARVAGEVAGKYHPHGSCYGTAVNMANEFSIRYPVIDPQGNFGFPLDGDGPAAERYTEMRLFKLGALMLKDINDGVVDFKPNYDEKDEEPVVLPSGFPYLLANGVSGIATGYTTDIPSHNINELCDALIALIKNSELTVKDLLHYVKGPDLVSGGYVIDSDQIFELYETGAGSLKFRAKIKQELTEDGTTLLVITELPPDVRKGSTDKNVGIVEKLHVLCVQEKKIPRVIDVRDESSTRRDDKTGKLIGEPVRIVIELHKTAVPDVIIKELYKQTALEKSKGFLLRAIVNQAPMILNLKDILVYYLEHRRDVVTRKHQFDLDKLKRKLHIVEGFKKILLDLDNVIQTIRNSDDPFSDLMKIYSLSKEQTTAILDMPLKRISKIEENKIDAEIASLNSEIERLTIIISTPSEIDNILINEFKQLKKDFGDERRTTILSQDQVAEITSTTDEPMVAIVTSKNLIKTIPETAFEDMIKNGTLRERQEVYTQGVKCRTSDEFVIFTETGEYVRVGFTDLLGQLEFLEGKKIASIVVIDNKDEKKQVIVVTKKGMIKKSGMQSFRARMRRLAPYINLTDNDAVVAVKLSDGDEKNTIIVATNKGTVHRFYEKVFSSSNPGGNGVPGIAPDVITSGEDIADIAVLSEENDNDNLIILYIKDNEGFYEKSMSIDEFRTKGRVSKGIVGAGVDLKGEVFDIKVTNKDFMIIDKKGVIHKQKFVSIPIQNRYNKPTPTEIAVLITDFF